MLTPQFLSEAFQEPPYTSSHDALPVENKHDSWNPLQIKYSFWNFNSPSILINEIELATMIRIFILILINLMHHLLQNFNPKWFDDLSFNSLWLHKIISTRKERNPLCTIYYRISVLKKIRILLSKQLVFGT